MSIKELLAWRSNCFFCQDELVIIPIFGDSSTVFNIENDYLFVKSDFWDFSIHIENGTIIDNRQDNLMSDDFINNSQLKIKCKCISCTSRGYIYEYSGNISLSPMMNHRKFVFRERVSILGKWHFCQIQNNNDRWGIVNTFKKDHDLNATNPKFELAGGRIITPFLDLVQLTPERLEHKLKTYIVFS